MVACLEKLQIERAREMEQIKKHPMFHLHQWNRMMCRNAKKVRFLCIMGDGEPIVLCKTCRYNKRGYPWQ